MDSPSRRTKRALPHLPASTEKCSVEKEIPASVTIDGEEYSLFRVCATGNLLLDVTFENTKSTVRLPTPQPGNSKPASLIRGVKSPNVRALYRVQIEALIKNSKYFEMLLSNTTFEEGLRINETLAQSKARGIELKTAPALDLPRISIRDEDHTTRVAGREHVFADLLSILHAGESSMRWTLTYSAVMAVMADLYDCAAVIARYVRGSKQMSWPTLQGTMTTAVEEAMRQKVLVAWLFDDQMKLITATKDLILRGSSQWTNETFSTQRAIWWDLPDELEAELHYRRHRILSCVWSLLKHFIKVYSSKERQCKYFYENSSSCDSFSLGEIIKFLFSKNLLSFVSSLSVDEEFPEAYKEDIDHLIQILRQCPSYQIDANHRHCGMRSRITPTLDYIQSMLTSNIGINAKAWRTDRSNASWEINSNSKVFEFTKRMSNDQRLTVTGLMVGTRHAQELFTASDYDWNPEEIGEKHDPNAKLGRAFGSMSGL